MPLWGGGGGNRKMCDKWEGERKAYIEAEAKLLKAYIEAIAQLLKAYIEAMAKNHPEEKGALITSE